MVKQPVQWPTVPKLFSLGYVLQENAKKHLRLVCSNHALLGLACLLTKKLFYRKISKCGSHITNGYKVVHQKMWCFLQKTDFSCRSAPTHYDFEYAFNPWPIFFHYAYNTPQQHTVQTFMICQASKNVAESPQCQHSYIRQNTLYIASNNVIIL